MLSSVGWLKEKKETVQVEQSWNSKDLVVAKTVSILRHALEEQNEHDLYLRKTMERVSPTAEPGTYSLNFNNVLSFRTNTE